MDSNTGDRIAFRLVPETTLYQGTVLSIDENTIVIKGYALPETIRAKYVVLSDTESDIDYYAEIGARDGGTLYLKRMWTGKRGYFRVDDVFPVDIRKVPDEPRYKKSRLFSGYPAAGPEYDVSDESVSPRLWKLLTDINAKLGAVLEKLEMERAGITTAEDRAVNISASGIRLQGAERYAAGDTVEVRMLLPLVPPVGILVPGTVVRVEDAGGGESRFAVEFGGMDDEVRDVIIQYTLRRQRELVRRRRQTAVGA